METYGKASGKLLEIKWKRVETKCKSMPFSHITFVRITVRLSFRKSISLYNFEHPGLLTLFFHYINIFKMYFFVEFCKVNNIVSQVSIPAHKRLVLVSYSVSVVVIQETSA